MLVLCIAGCYILHGHSGGAFYCYRTHALPPCFASIADRKTIKITTPRDIAFSNLNPVKAHAYMCSARDLEYARLRKLGNTEQTVAY